MNNEQPPAVGRAVFLAIAWVVIFDATVANVINACADHPAHWLTAVATILAVLAGIYVCDRTLP